MKKLSLSMVTILLAAVMLFTGILPMESAQAAGDTILNNLTVDYLLSNLEETIGFGVFAEKWEQNAHAESSACVDVFYKDIGGTDPFANSNNTYKHTLDYTLRANVTASGGKYLEGLKFALYKEDGHGDLVKCEGTEVTIGGGNQIKNATLTWSQKQLEGLENVELYVRQVEDASYVEDGGVNTQDMRVYYGPFVSHLENAENTIYVGKLEQKQIASGEMKFLNTMNYDPLLLFGKDVRLFYKEGDKYNPIEKEDRVANGEIYINYTVLNGENTEETHYAKFEGFNSISYDATTKTGTLHKGNAVIRFQYTDRTDYVTDLLTNKLNPFSVALATMGNGKGEIREGLKADPTGSSTLTGPVDSEGNVVSMYTVDISDKAVGYDGAYHLEASDFGKDYIPMAGNEYVVINVICPKSESEENPTVVVPHLPDKFFGNQSNQWGSNDSGNSERVLFNFVHKEGTEYKPYTGKVEPHSCFGTYFAPSAFVHVYRQTFNGQIIAKKVRNDRMEIHQRSIARLGRNTYVNMETGRISIQKVVNNGYSYAGAAGNGAEFGIFSKADCKPEDLVTTMTTSGGSDWNMWSQFKPASATSKWLPTGTYWVRELKSPDGYSINTTIVEVQVEAGQTKAVSKEGYTETINIYYQDYENVLVNDSDQFQGKLKIVKRDKDDHTKTLAGATFGIYEDKACNKLITYVTTGSDGTATIALHLDWQQMGPGPGIGMGPGYGSASKKYYVKELIAPEGYALDEKVHEVTVQDNIMDYTVDTTTLNVDNKLLTGRIRLYKESFDERKDGKPVRLGGAVFQLFYDEAHSQPVDGKEYTTLSDGREIGKLTISPVPYGTYWVYETKAPEGYELDPNRKAYKVVVNKPVEQPSDVEGDRANEDNNNNEVNVIVNKKKEIDTSLQLEIPVAKVIDPVGKAADETFTFTLEPAPSAPPAPLPADNDCSASVVGAGTATTDKFGVIEIKKDKFDSDTSYGYYNSVEYGWLVYENKGTNPSIEYDDTIYWVRTTVVRDDDGNMFFSTGDYDNNGNLILSDTAHLDISMYKPKPKDQQNSDYGFDYNNEYIGMADSVVFTNKVLTTSISVNKEWVGGAPANTDLTNYLTVHKVENGSLSDALKDANGNVLRPSKSADGKTYTFSDLPAGYTYAVKEAEVEGYVTTYPTRNDAALAGETIQNAKITTTGAFLTLKKTVKNLGNVPYAGAETFTFVVDCSSEVDKTEGGNPTSGAGDLGFFCELKNGDEEKVHFDFTQPGTYTVTVTEGKPAENPTDGMVYSKEIYQVIYRVELVGNALTVTGETWQYAQDVHSDELPKDIAKPDAVEFVNTYEKYALTLKKTDILDENKGLKDAVYGLYAEDDPDCQGTPVYTITTGEDGTGKVEDIAKGTYWLKEITAPEGYDVDPNPVKVMVPPSASSPDGSLNVNVADYPLGQVKVKKAWVGDTEANRPDSITVQLMKDGKAEGNPIQLTAENGWAAEVDGLQMYNPVNGEEISYTWKETVPAGYNLTGKVTETDENGVEVTTLTNTLYTAGGAIQFSGEKTLTGRKLEEGEFSFELSGGNLEKAEVVKNAADGTFRFSEIAYTQEDAGKKYTYTVKEQTNTIDTIIYDETVYEITVEVQDNQDGTLTAEVVSWKKNGQLMENQQLTISFENNYVYAYTDISGVKTMGGRAFREGDSFTLELWEENGTEPIDAMTIMPTEGGSEGFDFGMMEFDKQDIGKTYTYLVKENIPAGAVDGKLNGVIYDQTVYTVKLAVTFENDELKVTRTYWKGADEVERLLFSNGYETDGEIQFSGEKSLTGRKLEEGEFSFELSGGNLEKAEVVKNAADGSFQFSEIAYTEADINKEYVYTVKEVIPEAKADGITYDETIYTVKVKVTDAGDGKLNAEVISETAKDALDFTNTYNYKAQGSIQFSGTKTLTGDRVLAAEEFSFELTGGNLEKAEVVKNAADGTFRFSEIAYNEADINKEYVYTVKEVIPETKADGITYDETIYTVKVKVTDAGDGKLNAEVISETAKDALNFTNTYDYKAQGSIQFSGTKTLTGDRALAAEEFSFELTGGTLEKAEVVKNAADGTFRFSEIAYTEADINKEYVYTVKEVIPEAKAEGITYDETIYTVKVKVTDAGDGKLNAEVISETAKDALNFTNTYDYKAQGSIQFSGEKTLTGDRALAAEEFSFELTGGNLEKAEVVKNAADGTFRFSEIAYTEADINKEYVYTVQEVIPETKAEGITYDETIYTVKVKVTDAGDGKLNAEVISETAKDALNFTNTYDYKAQGSIQFSGTKTLTGDRALAAEEFSFELSGGNLEKAEVVKNAADGTFRFSEIAYTEADINKEYVYTVKEVIPEAKADGITYDETIYTVKVKVTDAGDGKLNAEVISEIAKDALNFTNTYDYKAQGSIQFSGTKTLTGDRALAAEEFSFELTGGTLEKAEVVKNAADGTFRFSEIAYTEADINKEYVYTVQEVIPEAKADGITYDETIYTVKVKVTDAGDGKLNAEVISETAKDAMNFTNTYDYKAQGSIQFSGTKTLTGGRALAAEEFSFELTGGNLEKAEVVKNTADGTFRFSEIAYTEADINKEYVYTVQEVIPETKADGITYDETIYTVKVKVTDAGDGKLNAEVISETAKDALNFVNKYEKYTASGELTLDVEKAMMGREFVSGDMFTFTISAVSGVPMPEKTMVTITPSSGKTAKVDFGKILFTEADADKEYVYTVKELAGQKEGITYDDKFHTVTVKLADDGKGNILATPTYADGSRVTLTNMYNAEGELTLDVEKTIKGRTFKTGDSFTFTITAAENVPMPEKTEVTLTPTEGTTAKVDFGKITYSLADAGKTYEYTLKEVAGQQDGITYDANAYTVKVTVADNGQGGLNVTPTYEAGSRVTFVNTYGATGTYQLTATKELIGKKLTDGQFTFVLKNEQGKELATATNTADGQITFKAFNFSQSDIGKTYTYYVSERMEGLEGYTYDTTVFEVKLTVSDNGDGTLTVTASGLPEGGMKFRNSYFASTNVVFYKKWQGKEGPAISLTLYQNGVKMDPQPEYVKVGNVYTYEGLPLYDENEKLFVYSATESFMDGYMTIYENKAPYAHVADQVMNGGTIINRGVSNVSVRKVWQGLAEGEQAPEITLSLYCNGVKLDKATPVPDKDGWYHYYNLPTTVDGVDAVYTVKEEAMEGFNTIYLSTSGEEAECAMNGDTIQNRKIPKTGDNTPIGLWMAVTALSAMGFVLAVKKRKTVG